MTTLLVVQPTKHAPVDRLGGWLADAGADLRLVHPRDDELPDRLDGVDGVICLGGGMGATDDDRWPWLAAVRGFLSRTVSAEVPLLSLCLGAQLLAVGTGGGIRKAERPEIGPNLVAKRDAAEGDPLFGPLPMTPDVIQFHNDEIHPLPPGAALLATSPRTDVQAFRLGRVAYGLQFHIETSPQTVTAWAQRDSTAAAAARPGQLEPDRLEQFHVDLAEVWQPFAERFVALAAGDLAPVTGAADPAGRSTLPLTGSVDG